MSRSLLTIAMLLILLSFVLSVTRLLSCLIVLENMNVLLLFNCLVCEVSEPRIFFLTLMVVFTVEAVMGLVILARLWDSSGLMAIVGV
uniref:NADH dehydrogenase subunit 4L n=1 Tax=Eurytrema pancreaticum TaxID=374591 RepID=A0A0E3Y6M0_EUTPN|nr:NADH dehydrogenase subunit 4L [Eurytrema pancreaticum]